MRRQVFWAATLLFTAAVIVQVGVRLHPPDSAARSTIAAPADRIPVPAAATLQPRQFAGVGALACAAIFLGVFFFRRRTFVLQWSRGWLYLGIAMFVLSSADPVAPSSWSVAVSGMMAIASAFTLIKGAESLGAIPRNRRRHALLSIACLTWYVFARLFLSRSVAFASSFAALAILLAIAGYSYLRLARHRRLLGAAIIGAVLVIIVSSNVVVAMSVPAMIRAENMTLGLLMTNIVCYSIVAAGMFVVVFEDMTVELRRTNRDLQSAQHELKRLAVTDALTGCHNRRHFEEVIRRELKRHARFQIPMTLLFIDVDRFKQVNDAGGHAAGDRVLVHVANTLRRHTREFDLLFRWGGDEFLLVLSCGETDARAKAAQLKQAFVASLPLEGPDASVGLSIGVVEVPGNAADILPVIEEADRRMYLDKGPRP